MMGALAEGEVYDQEEDCQFHLTDKRLSATLSGRDENSCGVKLDSMLARSESSFSRSERRRPARKSGWAAGTQAKILSGNASSRR